MKEVIYYHLHDDTSNCNGYADSCTNYKEYIKLAKKHGMKAIAFSNHGGIYDWIKKKQDCDKVGIKYIHGVELYLCTKLEADERGYHIGLYAKNYDGVLELNTLMSKATSKGINGDKTYRHFYYNPRISMEELMNTSSNIIITTACLASFLWYATVKSKELINKINKESGEDNYNQGIKLIKQRDIFLKWLSDNSDRCFLEIQYHWQGNDQAEYNKLLYNWSKEYNIPLIAGTDTHSSNDYKAECRKILQKSKNSYYGDEDAFDLTWKTYDELVECFKKQDALPEEIYLEAIANTIKFADMVENFNLDKTFKYPNLYGKEAIEDWKKDINKKFNYKVKNGIIDVSRKLEYKKQILEEFKAMEKQGMESFMFFMSELVDYCNENNIPYGFCRGSVGGSVIAYITDIIDVDPLIWGTVFSRFCNADRISLADIDMDFASEDRQKVYDFIIKKFTKSKTAYIAQFGTLKDRGTIDTLARGLDYKDLSVVKEIKNQFEGLFNDYSKIIQSEVNLEELEDIDAKSIDFDYIDTYANQIRRKSAIKKIYELKDSFEQLKKDNKDIFYYFDGIKGTIHSKGNHPAGIIGSPITLCDNLGVFYKDGNENMPVSTCAMKAVDSVNFVKFDILGLKTVGVLKDAYEFIGSHYLKSYEINWNDKNVWNDMVTSPVGVFQFEGDYAFSLLKEFVPQYINDMSLVNAALRPSGKSYRDRLIKREFNQNPSKEIDNLLKQNNGFLVYQEDTIKFLTDICGFSGSLADTTRRCVDENTFITMGNGNLKKIKDINIGERVMSANNHGVSESRPVLNVFNNGIKGVYKITTIHNKELIATEDHMVYTQDGYKEINQLTTNDSIMSLKKINSDKDNLKPQERLSCQEMFLIGMLIGDGTIYSITRTGNDNLNPSFTNSDIILIEKFKECIKSRIRPYKNNLINCEFTIHSQKGVEVEKIYNIRIKTPSPNNSLIRLLNKYDLRHHAKNKILPNELMNYPIGEKLQNLLGGLYSTDGGCYENYIDYSTISEMLALQIQYLLLKFNIYSYIIKRLIPEYNYYDYRVWISQTNSLQNFKKYILPYVIGEKQNRFKDVINKAMINKIRFNYLLPNKCKEEIRDNMITYKKSFNDIGYALGYQGNGFNVHTTEFGITDVKAKEISKELCIPYTYWLLQTDYIPLRVKNIEYLGESNVYDIEVKDNHNYIANGLVVHNCIGKKDVKGLNEQLPKILEGYCKVSKKPREIAEQEAKAFIQIVDDSSEYQFGYNHSTGYSMIGYACARLRKYHTLEFITAYLNRAEFEEQLLAGIKLAHERNIQIKPIQFRYSRDIYWFNKEENNIYKGIESIKGFGEKGCVGEELYKLKNNQYKNFIDLLNDIKTTTIGDAKVEVLIKLGYFSEFGSIKKLLNFLNLYKILSGKKQLKKVKAESLNITELAKGLSKETEKTFTQLDSEKLLLMIWNDLEDEDFTTPEKIKAELEYYGYIQLTMPNISAEYAIITEINTKYKNPVLTLYRLKTGEVEKIKIKKRIFDENPLKKMDCIKTIEKKQEKKWRKTEEGFTQVDELEDILTKYTIIEF